MSDLLGLLPSSTAAAGDEGGDCFGFSAAADGGGSILDVLDSPTDQPLQDEEGLKGMDELEEPKQEGFLGGGEGEGDYVFSDGGGGEEQLLNHGGNQDTDVPPQSTDCHYSVGRPSIVCIGLSMIKDWLRSQQPPATPAAPAIPAAIAAACSDQSSLSAGGGAWGLDAQSRVMKAVQRKPIETAAQKTSMYRGVTRHRWTGRYEAHLWDNSCRREGQTRKGKQVYLGGYDKEEKAARAYDLAALKYWGTGTAINFPISTYEKELERMKSMSRQQYVAWLRRNSSGFSRGASMYRGVTRHHQQGRWQARIGRVAGNKDLYLGTFGTEKEAAEAYDIAAIKFRGQSAVTNFDIDRYDVNSILEGRALPITGTGASKRIKALFNQVDAHAVSRSGNTGLMIADSGVGAHNTVQHHGDWPSMAYPQVPQQLVVRYPYSHPRAWCKPKQGAGLYKPQQPQMWGNAYNYIQPPTIQCFMDKGSSSDDFMYNGVVGYGGHPAQMPAIAVQQNVDFQAATSGYGDGNMVSIGSEVYGGRDFYLDGNAIWGDTGYGQNQAPSASSMQEMAQMANDVKVAKETQPPRFLH